MERVDWNNPPNEIRFVRNLKTGKITRAQDVSVKPRKIDLKIKYSLLEVFAAGSEIVNITLNGLPSLEYKRTKDFSQYKREGKQEVVQRNLIYKLVDCKKFSF